MFKYQDPYFKKAKEQGYVARSAFKLEEIQNKFHLIDKKTKIILDIGCAPGSWMQYTSGLLLKLGVKGFKILGFDIQDVKVKIPNITTYKQDVTDVENVKKILTQNNISKVDFIQSDMAPFTIGLKDIDAIRAFGLIEETLRIYNEYLKEDGRFAIKLFMGPGFDELVLSMKKKYGGKNIKLFKPNSSRKESKEIFLIKI
ncbi:RlmE family RNA methyltransferase [Candidatus Gracilibacteria bacterium]|nr:RlmE family RNA methyltransferase [Candidatus Gracilibacteria bacterium]